MINKYKTTTLFLIFLIVLCRSSLSQIYLPAYNLHYKNFFIKDKNDSVLLQSDIKKNFGDGEYYIYYDKDLTKLWMHGSIYNNKLEGKWEFRDIENIIFCYKMFSNGIQIDIDSPENTFTKIFLPNKIFEYRAYYISTLNDTLTSNIVTLKITSQIYEIRHNPRFEGIWTFQNNKNDSLLIGGKYPWNNWEQSTICLITENESQIQIYPPRCNQFVFTEIIKFPSVSPLFLKHGYKWESQIQIPENYILKEWENTIFYHKSEIIGKRVFSCLDKNLECWIIKGESFNQDFGTAYFEYLFNEEYGFVLMEWTNYDNQKAIFELINLKIEN